jgi:hypothetical protein
MLMSAPRTSATLIYKPRHRDRITLYVTLNLASKNVGKTALIHRALYGGKTAGRDFRNHLQECMKHLGLKSCLADPDVWMQPAVRPDGHSYWEYVLLYTDDCLTVSHRGEHVLRKEIGKYFELKKRIA